MYVTLTPAYGRDYKSQKEVLADWNADKDFMINCVMHPADGRYINKSSAPKEDTYNIRYAKNTKVLPVRA